MISSNNRFDNSLRGRLRGADSMLEAVSSLQEWLNKIVDKGELYDQPQDDHGEEGFGMVASGESDSTRPFCAQA